MQSFFCGEVMKQRLENWEVIDFSEGLAVMGNVYNSSKWPDGKSIITSTLTGWNPVEDAVITKSGSEYVLGVINSNFALDNPNALKELMVKLMTIEKGVPKWHG